VTFQDTQLQQCYDRNLAGQRDDSVELREVHALIDTHDCFLMLEGSHSARVHETIDHLLSTRIRLALRGWYCHPGVRMDSTAIEFRNQLSRLAGERLEDTVEISPHPS
jgi:hypothetical protein